MASNPLIQNVQRTLNRHRHCKRIDKSNTFVITNMEVSNEIDGDKNEGVRYFNLIHMIITIFPLLWLFIKCWFNLHANFNQHLF